MASHIRYSGITSTNSAPADVIEESTIHGGNTVETSESHSYSYASMKKQDLLIFLSAILILLGAFDIFLFRSVKFQTHRELAEKTSLFERNNLSPIPGSNVDKNSENQYPAILLYKFETSDDLYGHIPKEWVDSGEPLLLVDQITKGVGVRELWWDPGNVISQNLVHFNTAGLSKLILVAPQEQYRGLPDSSYKRSFADAIYWSTDIIDRDEYGFIVKLTDFLFLPEGVGRGDNLSGRIKKSYGIKYILDLSRSFVHLPGCHCGQRGSSVEMNFTYVLQDSVESANAMSLDSVLTVSLKRTFLKLEKIPKFKMRKYHPKSGFNSISYKNESESLLQPIDKHYLTRLHLINKTADKTTQTVTAFTRNVFFNDLEQNEVTPLKNRNSISDSVTKSTSSFRSPISASFLHPFFTSGANEQIHPLYDENVKRSTFRSKTVNSVFSSPLPDSSLNSLSTEHPTSTPNLAADPLQLLYLIDHTTPSPIREALVDGINWWDEAFQYAGYLPGTFRAKIAPHDFDPFNLIRSGTHFVQWVDRDRRSFSVGLRVSDPRTGQIMTGHAIIDSSRMRQDALIAEALLGPFSFPNGSIDTALESQIMAALMARCRSLGAHEVGHTLGLTHNFAGSSYYSGPASVMDYPAPIVMLDSHGNLALGEDSYAQGVGFFDKIAINYGYRIFNENNEDPLLQRLIDDAEAEGYVFLTDQWDSGLDPISALKTALHVRQQALSKLSSRSVPGGAPLDSLQEILPPVFLWHRYEVVAAAKMLGGAMFQYTLRGDRNEQKQGLQPVAGDLQRKALDQLLLCLAPSQLTVPSLLLPSILPEAFGFQPAIGGAGDVFGSRSGALFDRLAATESAANIVVSAVFSPQRAERLATQKQLNTTLPSLSEILRSFTSEVILSRYPDRTSVSIIESNYGVSVKSVLIDGMDLFHKENINRNNNADGAIESHYLESMVAQSVLVNAYLILLIDPRSSALVTGQIKSHLRSLLADIFDIIANLKKIAGEEDSSFETIAHLELLSDAITMGKPFLRLLPSPLGPPI